MHEQWHSQHQEISEYPASPPPPPLSFYKNDPKDQNVSIPKHLLYTNSQKVPEFFGRKFPFGKNIWERDPKRLGSWHIKGPAILIEG